jgi:hypothetical protein
MEIFHQGNSLFYFMIQKQLQNGHFLSPLLPSISLLVREVQKDTNSVKS